MLEATVTVKLINVCSEEITQVSPKVATSKAISLRVRNKGNYSYNNLYQTDP